MAGVWRREAQEMHVTGHHDFRVLQARPQGAEIQDGD